MIAVSMGDPSGIGIEIALKTWAHDRVNTPEFFIIGKIAVFEAINEQLGLGVPLTIINAPSEAHSVFQNALPILECDGEYHEFSMGAPNSDNAEIIINSIRLGTQYCLENKVSAITTLPIAKSVLYKAGFKFPGHTEYISHLCSINSDNNYEAIMMLSVEGLRVALVTIHETIANVPKLINKNKIIELSRALDKSMREDFGIKTPKIALLGLNPHAGESGTIGTEEIEIINPAAGELRNDGIDISYAMPADTAFADFNRAKYDCYLAMYHDQGLIPIKTIDFHGGVNTSLNLPIIRTSPDHGTGFEIAGKNIARNDSFVNALRMAALIATNRENAS